MLDTHANPKRLAVFLLVAGIHIAALVALIGAMNHPTRAPASAETFVTTFIQPRIRDAGPEPDRHLSQLSLYLRTSLSNLRIPQPSIDFSVSRNDAASIAAPSLQYSAVVAMRPYIKEAALLPGEGATVVLRIEVLDSGEPGDIEIDTSSGSPQVDRAAIEYARTQHWYAGRVNNVPKRMWVRWGVRLQA
jgi:TonB family protein